MPKPGWTLTLCREPLAAAYESLGVRINDTVAEVTWRAQATEYSVQDAWYDEFVLRGQTPALPGVLWFKVLQVCEKGQADWDEVPNATGARRA